MFLLIREGQFRSKQRKCEVADNERTYCRMMADVLKKKLEVLRQLNEETLKQEIMLGSDVLDEDAFTKTMEAKDVLIDRLDSLDDGFMDLYARLEELVRSGAAGYEQEIKSIQTYVRQITDLSASLEALEKRNHAKLSVYLTQGKQKIKDYKLSSKTVSAYYKNMSGKHQDGDSYFFNRQK